MDALLNADWELLSAVIVGSVIFLLLAAGIVIGFLPSKSVRVSADSAVESVSDTNVFYPLPETKNRKNRIGAESDKGFSFNEYGRATELYQCGSNSLMDSWDIRSNS